MASQIYKVEFLEVGDNSMEPMSLEVNMEELEYLTLRKQVTILGKVSRGVVMETLGQLHRHKVEAKEIGKTITSKSGGVSAEST